MDKNLLIINLDHWMIPFHHGYAKKMKEKGFNLKFITVSRMYERVMKKQDWDVVHIKDIIKKISSKNDYLLKNKYEKKYHVKLFNFIPCDRACAYKSKKYCELRAVRYFKAYEYFFDNNNIDYVVTQQGGEMIRKIGIVVINHRRIKIMHLGFGGPIPSTYLLDKTDMSTWVNPDYMKHEPTKQEEKMIDNFIKKFKKKKIIIYSLKLVSPLLIKKYLILWKRFIIDEHMSYEYNNMFRITQDRFIRLLRALLSKFLYTKPDFNRKYIYFPLHLPDDAQLTVRGRKYFNQIDIVKKVAKVIPSEYKLYVKEHPNAGGALSLRDLKQITNIPNVMLLPRPISSHSIIKNTEVIVTINSTVGWESLLYFKPVVNLAPAFYRVPDVVYVVEDIDEDLKRNIEEAIKKGVDRKKIKRFINAVMKSLCRGNLFDTLEGKNTYKVDNYNLDEKKTTSIDEIFEELAQNTIKFFKNV